MITVNRLTINNLNNIIMISININIIIIIIIISISIIFQVLIIIMFKYIYVISDEIFTFTCNTMYRDYVCYDTGNTH